MRYERRRRRSSSSRSPSSESFSGKKGMVAAALLSAAAVFVLMCAWFLKRDLTDPRVTLEEARASITSTAMDELALAALEAQREEAGRELRAMLAAQEVVLAFLQAESVQAMQAQVDQPTAAAAWLPQLRQVPEWKKTTQASPLLLTKRRLPQGSGYLATWQAGPWQLQTDDSSGLPKIRWEALRAQLEKKDKKALQATAAKKKGP